MNLKFERFHCLNCENYDLCTECFRNDIHKEMGHHFIMRKHSEDKWIGCDYSEKYDDFYEEEGENNKKSCVKINLSYLPKNISLVNYLTNCLDDYKNEKNMVVECDNSSSLPDNNTNQVNANTVNDNVLGELTIHNLQSRIPKCAICKSPTKLDYGKHNAKTMEFLMLKYIKNCKHVVHVKCCQKLFKVVGYENNNKTLKVTKSFNKCRHDNKCVFPGLNSVDFIYEKDKYLYDKEIKDERKSSLKKRSYTPNSGISLDMIVNVNLSKKTNLKLPLKSVSKRMLIDRIMLDAKKEQEERMGFGLLNIQKINFNRENDIQKFEKYENDTYSYNNNNSKRPNVNSNKSTQKLPSIPYARVHTQKELKNIHVKQTNDLNKSNNENTQNNVLINTGNSLIVQKYNARPIRYQTNSNVMLSPLLFKAPNY